MRHQIASPDRSRTGWRRGSAPCCGSCGRPRRCAPGSACRGALPPVVDHRHPQAEDLGAALLDDLLRHDGVAERLRHLAAVVVDDEAVRDHRLDTARAAACPAPTSSELWNQPRYWSLPSRYMSAGHGQLRALRQHRLVARAGVEPDVEDVASRARTRCRRTSGTPCPSGTNSSSGRSYQASAPCCVEDVSDALDQRRRSAATRRHAVQETAGIGTPQARWREMHQSGRLASMLWMRSSPQAGIHSTPLDRLERASAACAAGRRRSRSIAMNHCGVARKITGLWQRQQCG